MQMQKKKKAHRIHCSDKKWQTEAATSYLRQSYGEKNIFAEI